MSRLTPRRNEGTQSSTHDRKACGIILPEYQSGQTNTGSAAINIFGNCAQAETHRAACVNRKDSLQTCFLLELLDAIAVAFAEHAPIQQADFITGIVGAMFGELRAAPLVFRPMASRKEPVNNVLRKQFKAFDLRQILRTDGFQDCVHVSLKSLPSTELLRHALTGIVQARRQQWRRLRRRFTTRTTQTTAHQIPKK